MFGPFVMEKRQCQKVVSPYRILYRVLEVRPMLCDKEDLVQRMRDFLNMRQSGVHRIGDTWTPEPGAEYYDYELA